jgi:hypothetical protein
MASGDAHRGGGMIPMSTEEKVVMIFIVVMLVCGRWFFSPRQCSVCEGRGLYGNMPCANCHGRGIR